MDSIEQKKRTFIMRPKEDMQLNYEPKSPAKKPLIIFLVIIFVVVVVVLAGFLFRSKVTEPTPLPIATTQPLPTPSPLIRSDISFEVLNGSGVSGVAKKISSSLQALGYQVVKTGNAQSIDYLKTQIFIKNDLSEKINVIIADLKDVIKIASVAGELKDSTASARIIVGKDSI